MSDFDIGDVLIKTSEGKSVFVSLEDFEKLGEEVD